MKNHGVSKRAIKSDELFSKGLDKLSWDLRCNFLNERINIKKNDIKKLAYLDIIERSISNLEHLQALVN